MSIYITVPASFTEAIGRCFISPFATMILHFIWNGLERQACHNWQWFDYLAAIMLAEQAAVRRLLVWTRWATLSWEQMAEGSGPCVDTDPCPPICQGASPKCWLTVPCHLHRSEYSMSMFGFKSSQNKHQVRKRHPTSRQYWQGALS